MIGAGIEHGGGARQKEREQERARRLGSAVEGLPDGLLRLGISPQCGADRGRKGLLFRRTGVLVGLAKTVASEQKDLGVLYQRSAMGVAIVVL